MGAYAGVAVLAGLLFYFFNPAGAGDCSFNISVITMTLVLALVVSAVSMLPYVRAHARGCDKGMQCTLMSPCIELLSVGSDCCGHELAFVTLHAPCLAPNMAHRAQKKRRHFCIGEHVASVRLEVALQ